MFQNLFEGWELGLPWPPCNVDFLGLGLENFGLSLVCFGSISQVYWKRPMNANGVRI